MEVKRASGLRAHTTTRFQHSAARRVVGVAVQQVHQGGRLVVQPFVFARVVPVDVAFCHGRKPF